jgi:hypothetical protein
VSIAAKWNRSQKYVWECRGAAACEELLNEADEILAKAAETQMKIVENGQDKLVNLEEALQSEAEDISGEELIELKTMAQMLMSSDGLDILRRARVVFDEANEAENRSFYQIDGLRRRLIFITGSEAGSIMRERPHGQKTDKRGEAPIQQRTGPAGGGTAAGIYREERENGASLPPSRPTVLAGQGEGDFISGQDEKMQGRRKRSTWDQSGLRQGEAT